MQWDYSFRLGDIDGSLTWVLGERASQTVMELGETVEENQPEDAIEITIDRLEMGTGWVCFQGGENPPSPNQLPYFLNDALTNWLTRNPEFNVKTILPIVVDGNTMAINVWFE